MYGIHRPGSQNKALGSEILEASFLLTLLPAFAESRAKRLIKASKLYAGDTGLALHLCGILEAEALGREPKVGVWLENVVLNDLLAWRETGIIKPGIFSTTVAISCASRKRPSPRRWGPCSERR